jgi:hypothetical protein
MEVFLMQTAGISHEDAPQWMYSIVATIWTFASLEEEISQDQLQTQQD